MSLQLSNKFLQKKLSTKLPNERCQYPRAEPWTQAAMAAYSAAGPRGILTFRSLHSLGNGTNKLSRSTHPFENKYPVILLFGPTGVGKTDLIFKLFTDKFEVINSDSMQVYRGMDIGSAKPSTLVLDQIPHHLIDIMLPSEQFNAGIFVNLADRLIPEILGRGKIPVISGGTAFYFKSFLYGLPELPEVSSEVRESLQRELEKRGLESMYRELQKIDPVRAGQLEPGDSYRILRALEVFHSSGSTLSSYKVPESLRRGINPLVIGLTRSRNELYERINMRVDLMMHSGLQEEVKRLVEEGYTESDPGMKGIGYSEFFLQARTGEFTIQDVTELIKRNSRRYAKRQLTFFKKLPGVRWFIPEDEKISETVNSFLKNV